MLWYIYIEYIYNSKSYSLSNRDVTSCSSEAVIFYLNSISSVLIKVKRLSSNSNYTVTVSNISTTTEFLWGIMVGIGAIVFVLTIIAIITVVVLIVVLKRKKASKYKELPQNKEKISKYVENTLSIMSSGLFKHWNSGNHQDSCVIWLESFTENDLIHITNEWNHLFHSNWLKTWYLNSAPNKLLCPICQTENTPNSIPQETNIFSLEALEC